MPQSRRMPAHLVTPAHEDSGIFKSTVSSFSIELVPLFGETMRRDLVIKGFLDGDTAIDVVFPGRRKPMTDPLYDRLKKLWAQSVAAARYANPGPEIDSVRLPVSVEGAWRPRFKRDDHGWETRQHQLYVARWTIWDAAGKAQTFGTPVVR